MGVAPHTVLARALRGNLTEAERCLWAQLRRRQLKGSRFRRQVPIGVYVVDFVCFEARLIVEVDGGQHAERTGQDELRDAWLVSQGFRVIRFWNNEVLGETEAVVEAIGRALGNPPPHPSPARGEGETRNG
jgi:very-short-patch-repair endonuclease